MLYDIHVHVPVYMQLPIMAVCSYTEVDVMTVMFIAGVNFNKLNAGSSLNVIHTFADNGFNTWS